MDHHLDFDSAINLLNVFFPGILQNHLGVLHNVSRVHEAEDALEVARRIGHGGAAVAPIIEDNYV